MIIMVVIIQTYGQISGCVFFIDPSNSILVTPVCLFVGFIVFGYHHSIRCVFVQISAEQGLRSPRFNFSWRPCRFSTFEGEISVLRDICSDRTVVIQYRIYIIVFIIHIFHNSRRLDIILLVMVPLKRASPKSFNKIKNTHPKSLQISPVSTFPKFIQAAPSLSKRFQFPPSLPFS